MNRHYVYALLLGVAPAVSLAAPPSNPADQYFSTENPKLTPQEREGIAIAQKWQAAGTNLGARPDGSIRLLFGAAQPGIVCAVPAGVRHSCNVANR
jgi:type IV secretion system protein VirB9